MSGQLSLIVTPTKLDNNEEGPPQFYVLRNEVWREVPQIGSVGKPSEVRTTMDDQLTTIMNNPVGARAALVVQFQQFWATWVPDLVQRDVADLARGDGDPPCLMLYVHPTLEWIPWELMHDGEDFLGLRNVIARLPIVRRGPSSMPETRVVNRVCSFLAENLMDAAQEDEWSRLSRDCRTASPSTTSRPTASGPRRTT